MNERIEELWDKAAEDTMDYSWESQTKFMERFAELIVQECQIALQPALRDMISRGQACDIIKKHFGVTQ
jgi:hypothetical protein